MGWGVILLLTLKERAITWSFVVAVSLDPRSSIDNFFRSKRVILSLTLKERAIHVCLASLLRQYPSIDNFFRSKGVFTHLRFLFVLASSLACFFVYTLGEICGRSVFRTRKSHTSFASLCICVGGKCGRNLWSLLHSLVICVRRLSVFTRKFVAALGACLKHEMAKWRNVTPASLNSASVSLNGASVSLNRASVSLNITDLKVVSSQ